jgi:hypothetical protein
MNHVGAGRDALSLTWQALFPVNLFSFLTLLIAVPGLSGFDLNPLLMISPGRMAAIH